MSKILMVLTDCLIDHTVTWLHKPDTLHSIAPITFSIHHAEERFGDLRQLHVNDCNAIIESVMCNYTIIHSHAY